MISANQRKRNRKCYLKNKAAINMRLKKRSEENRQLVRDAKNKPCADCGKSYPYWVMDLDHVRGKKVKAVSKMAFHSGRERILAEISKCDVVCSNCHRERTQKRKNGIVV